MSVAETITKIEKGLSPAAKYFGKGTSEYAKSTTYYWGGSNENPVIVIQPAIWNDVSVILKALAEADPDVGFGVKGGGHIAVPGFNSSTAILVDMALFNDIIYNPKTTLVDVGPGSTWDEVYAALVKPFRVNVAGATTCQGVGVAGFNLGGGYGNKTNQYGLAIDNIKAIDVVLPTGEFVTADAQNNEDVFWALKGGGNNFGIVTKWTLVTYPQGDIYSSTLHYESQYFARLITAILEFSKLEVPKSNVEAIFEYTFDDQGEVQLIANVELFYDGKEPPKGLFDPFTSIPHLWQRLDRTWDDRQKNLPRKHQTYRVGRPNDQDDLPEGFRGRFSSVMISHYTESLIQKALDLANDYSKKFASHGGLQIYPDIWPFLPTIFDNSPPSAWPHIKGTPRTPLVLNFKWKDEANDSFWLAAIEEMTVKLRAVALEQGCTTLDTAEYYNLALDNVTAFDVYRDNLDRLRTLRQKYDPSNVMNRTGGFRIS